MFIVQIKRSATWARSGVCERLERRRLSLIPVALWADRYAHGVGGAAVPGTTLIPVAPKSGWYQTAADERSAKDLDGATICVLPGTSKELSLADWFRQPPPLQPGADRRRQRNPADLPIRSLRRLRVRRVADCRLPLPAGCSCRRADHPAGAHQQGD